MGLNGASPARGAGALRGGCYIVGLEFTTSSEAVTSVSGQTGFTVGDFTAGVAALTFPKHFRFLHGHGNDDDTVTTGAARQKLLLSAIDYAAGTAVLQCVDGDAGDDEAIADDTYRLILYCGE